MDNIFDNNFLYPGYDDLLKEYFRDYFDSVFICLSPFFQLKNGGENYKSLRQANLTSLEELQEKNQTFKNLAPSDNRVIYSYDNTNYPEFNTIINTGLPVKWQYIIDNTNFKNFSQVNLALKNSIGALSKDFKRQDLQQQLDDFTKEHYIYQPTEGRITALSLISIYKCLMAVGKLEVIVSDEFFYDRKTINISQLTAEEFATLVRGYMYFFPIDRSLLFTIEWDSFYFLICGSKVLLDEIVPKFDFEGFFSDNETFHNWYANEKI